MYKNVAHFSHASVQIQQKWNHRGNVQCPTPILVWRTHICSALEPLATLIGEAGKHISDKQTNNEHTQVVVITWVDVKAHVKWCRKHP